MAQKHFNSYRKLNRLLEEGTVFCAIDTETTGLKQKDDRVMEIGCVKFTKNEELGRFSVLINPECQIPPVVTELTHITNELVSNEKTFKEISADFLEFIKGTTLIAHNANFDLGFLNAELERLGHKELQNQYIDTLQLTRWAFPMNGHWTQQYLAKQFEIDIEAAHRAYDDARVCKEIFLKTIEKIMDVQR